MIAVDIALPVWTNCDWLERGWLKGNLKLKVASVYTQLNRGRRRNIFYQTKSIFCIGES